MVVYLSFQIESLRQLYSGWDCTPDVIAVSLVTSSNAPNC